MTIMPWTGPGPNPEQPWGAPANPLRRPRRGGLFGASAQTADMPMTATEQPMAPKKGFDWGKLIGVLGDSLSIVGGGQASYVPMMQQQRLRRDAQAYAEQQYQRRRGDEQQDWQQREQWKRENPAPINNDTVADYEFYKRTLTPDQFKTWLQNKVDPPQYRQGADGQFYRINTSPPPTFTEDDWNKGTPVTGGPTPSASGGF